MKKIESTILLLLLACVVQAQPYFIRKDSIPVSVGGNTLLFPFAGGLNYPLFSNIDLDQDGRQDLFVFDISNNRVLTFLNTGQGSFPWKHAPYYEQFFPALSGWAFLYDYNCDGKADLFTDAPANNGIMQYRNDSPPGSLQFTLVDPQIQADYGGGSFFNILASAYLMPHLNDIDGDGDMDIIGQQFFCVGAFAYYRNMSMEHYGVCDSINDYVLETNSWGHFSLRSGAFTNVAVGAYNIACTLPEPSDMYAYKVAERDDTYAHIYTIDIDGDGDKDALIGDSGTTNSLLVVNGGTNMSANMVSQDTAFPSYNVPVNLPAFTSHEYLDADNDGVKDLLVSQMENDNKQGVMFYKNTATTQIPQFSYQTRTFLQDQMIDVGEGAAPVLFDADGDGLKDLVIGTRKLSLPGGGRQTGLTLFRNTGTPTAPAFEWVTDDYANVVGQHLDSAYYPAFGDLDGDGDMDMMLGGENGKLYLFKNSPVSGVASFTLSIPNYMGIDVGNGATPQLVDLNNDGLLDIVCGEKGGVVNYFQNLGSPNSAFFSASPTNSQLGNIQLITTGLVDGYTVPYVFEYGGHHRMAVSCMQGDVYLYTDIDSNLAGTFTVTDTLIREKQGVRTAFNITVSGGDINNDGMTDLLFGNYGGGLTVYYQEITDAVTEVPHLSEMTVFPNPSQTSVHLHLISDGKPGRYTLHVLDVTGRVLQSRLLSRNDEEVDVSTLSDGIYFLQMNDAGRTLTHRIAVIR